MKRLAIIGGGYAGVTLAKALDADFDVVLIERRDRFYHNVGAMRAYADPSLFERLLIPYDRLLRRGRILRQEAVEALPGRVRINGGMTIEADLIVVATGSRHAVPFKSGFLHSVDFMAEAAMLSGRLAAASEITILGDGPVAVELAGEVSWRFPGKRLRLFGAADRLLPRAGNPRLGEKLRKMLEGRGVEIQLGRGATDGRGLEIRAFGAETTVPCLGLEGRVKVDANFRVPGMPGVFAIGDAADCGDPQLTFLATRQAAYLARYLKNPRIAPYQPAPRVAMAVPLGPELGATQLPLPGLPVVGSWLTSRLKGRDLFIEKNWALLNRPSR